MIIRPTSETIIGETIAKWVNSYRDLPLKLNQWANVMRWEMRPRLFLRTAEFLWQEGHNAFATAEEANADARRMLEVYAEFSRNVMAIPVFEGEKTPEERFPGASATYTIEAVLQDGKALQSGTSHDLGQTFSRSANIRYQSAEGGEEFAWTTSWGMSSRMIGGLIMTHGDDDGMRMPPKVAPHHVIIIPIIHDDADRAKILDYAETLARRLKNQSIRVDLDASDKKHRTNYGVLSNRVCPCVLKSAAAKWKRAISPIPAAISDVTAKPRKASMPSATKSQLFWTRCRPACISRH